MTTATTPQLVRAAGFWGLVAMCLNAVIGSGVFLLPHESYVLLGPVSLWAPLVFAVPVFILVLAFAEAASHFDQPGGAYLYARTAFGDFVGFETGWMNWLARVTSLASLSNGFVLALGLLVPWLAEGWWRAGILTTMIGGLAAVHLMGFRHGAASIYVLTLGKIVPLAGFIVVALAVWKTNPIPGSWTLPGAEADWAEAALFMLFAYAGFENLAVPAGEFKNPRRDLPLALLVGTLAIAVIYSLVQLGAMSALPDLSQSKTPVASAAAALIGPAGALIVTIGALLSMAGTNSGTVLEGSRMLYALALDRPHAPPITIRKFRFRIVNLAVQVVVRASKFAGVAFSRLARIHPRWHTPTAAIVVHAGFALALALGGTFRQLALLSTVARLATYLVTCLALPRLRRLSPGFRTPGLVIPILGTIVALMFVLALDRWKLLAGTLALAVGAVVYLVSRPSAAR